MSLMPVSIYFKGVPMTVRGDLTRKTRYVDGSFVPETVTIKDVDITPLVRGDLDAIADEAVATLAEEQADGRFE